jgi:DNA methylase
MRHRFHALCPYFAMFPESFAETWIERLSQPNEWVLDPFCGRGTAPFQALLMGRRAIANDINPVAFCVTRAKTNAPTESRLKRRLRELKASFSHGDWSESIQKLPPFFLHAYAGTTLTQLLHLQSQLRWRTSREDCMIAAIVLGALHGESQKSPYYLSNQMPRTISTKPEYSVRYWQRHGLVAPERDAFEVILQRIEYRYASEPTTDTATVVNGDFRGLSALMRGRKESVRLVVTSPPYLDTTSYEEDQWLRLWFLGEPPHPTYRKISRDDRHERPEHYWLLIADLWRVLGQIMAPDSNVVLRMGGRKLTTENIVAGLDAASLFSGRKVRLVSQEESLIAKRQTGSFRPGSTGCVREVDCHFHVS